MKKGGGWTETRKRKTGMERDIERDRERERERDRERRRLDSAAGEEKLRET